MPHKKMKMTKKITVINLPECLYSSTLTAPGMFYWVILYYFTAIDSCYLNLMLVQTVMPFVIFDYSPCLLLTVTEMHNE